MRVEDRDADDDEIKPVPHRGEVAWAENEARRWRGTALGVFDFTMPMRDHLDEHLDEEDDGEDDVEDAMTCLVVVS